jgi:DNA-binding CsgD family transcriptional regulator
VVSLVATLRLPGSICIARLNQPARRASLPPCCAPTECSASLMSMRAASTTRRGISPSRAISPVGMQIALGHEGDARTTLETARAALVEIGATPALARADRLLEGLDAGPPAGLTAREIEVLRLVATGLTNAEIARELFISRHTVDHHLRSIYGKLNVPSRAAATRYAIQHNIM